MKTVADERMAQLQTKSRSEHGFPILVTDALHPCRVCRPGIGRKLRWDWPHIHIRLLGDKIMVDDSVRGHGISVVPFRWRWLERLWPAPSRVALCVKNADNWLHRNRRERDESLHGWDEIDRALRGD